MRHAAIYGIPWPRRTPLPGTTSNFLPTPKESTPVESSRRVTHKVLPDLDRKLAAAASSKKKRRGSEEDVEVEKPTKKTKTTPSQSSGKGKERQDEEEDVKRKRGRPRLSSPLKKPEPVVKTEEDENPTLHSKSFKSQSRHMNGRFGASTAQHSPSASPDRAQRALEREKQKEKMEKEQEERNKRRSDEDEDDENDEPEPKRARYDDGQPPLRRVFPRPASIRGGNLFGRPNPLSFATRAWSGLVISDDGSSEDEKGPQTPEDSATPPAINIESAEEVPAVVITTAGITPSLTFKPSPFTFARRRWSSLCTSPTDDDQSEASLSFSQSVREDESLSSKSLSSGSWVLQNDMYSSEEEDVRREFPPKLHFPPSNVSSPLSTADDLDDVACDVQPKYPLSAPSFRKSASFFSHTSSLPPNFIDAGWDQSNSLAA
ncbi:hypothetical protein K435DRAFT_351527 [Dendrothele bispora CBS 962.96]|uniref:Uncharacterized protein n=1 Tax=Dendrothele bispora (strain CBS 962.96) TaxID=1314807 RepID=A0A4S8MJJ7_DENBC|nr:hypothetical protein K435DRAFT_351527 [Dendrothele bispora CBS 962.96]